MLTPYVPYPPSSGGQIRTLNLLKYLSKRHHITLVALYKNYEEKKYLSHLKRYCRKIYLCRRPKKPWQLSNIFKAVFSRLPFLIIRNYSNEAKNIIKKLLNKENFDVIHAETFYIMPHIPDTKTPIILVEQTIEYKVYQHFINSLPFFIKIPLYLDIIKLKYWERYYWRKANIVVAVSQPDEKIIKELESNINTSIVPNGAGDEMFAKKLLPKNLKKPVIIFQGNYNWLQNVEAARFLILNIYPKLRRVLPNIKIIISGQNADKIFNLRKKDVQIVNIAPDDSSMVKAIFEKGTFFIAPIFGPGGTRLKILAAMASGIPVISTKTGIEGLEITNQKDVLLASSTDDFVKKISFILSQPRLFQTIRKNAYLLVKKKYSWQNIAQKLETVYQSIK